MDKTRILGIAPYEGIQFLMQQVAERRSDIELTTFIGDLKEGLRIASKYTPYDFDIIVSRGGTAELIRNSCSIPVVEISLSAMDILRSIKLAQNANNKYALIGFPAITKNAQLLCDLLQYSFEIYTIHSESEVKDILEKLTQNGIHMILCDMVTYSIAQSIGLTAILITSGSESVELAFDQAIETKKTYDLLTSQIIFYKTLIEEHPQRFCVYNDALELIYHSKNTTLPDIVEEEMQNKVSFVLKEKNTIINKIVFGLLYVINGQCRTFNNKLYVVFYISSHKVPLSTIKDGIQYLNKDEANNKLQKSFYGIALPLLFPDSSINQYAKCNYPIMIVGEEGTGKEHLAYLLYAKSKSSNHPFVVLDCIRFSPKIWSFLTDDSLSPLSGTSTTIYIKNMERLSQQQYEELFSIIHDLNLCTKNRIIFTFSNSTKDSIAKRCTQIINHFSCLTIRVPSLREHIEYIPNLCSIYISNLNVSMAKEVLGLDQDALTIMKSYDWPGNYNQFKKVINELVTITDTPYITGPTVTKLLQKEVPSSKTNSSGIKLSLMDKTLEDINLDIIRLILSEEGGNHSSAAQRLGISRTTLWRMLQKTSYPK